jgi:hypothetical protein
MAWNVGTIRAKGASTWNKRLPKIWIADPTYTYSFPERISGQNVVHPTDEAMISFLNQIDLSLQQIAIIIIDSSSIPNGSCAFVFAYDKNTNINIDSDYFGDYFSATITGTGKYLNPDGDVTSFSGTKYFFTKGDYGVYETTYGGFRSGSFSYTSGRWEHRKVHYLK